MPEEFKNAALFLRLFPKSTLIPQESEVFQTTSLADWKIGKTWLFVFVWPEIT